MTPPSLQSDPAISERKYAWLERELRERLEGVRLVAEVSLDETLYDQITENDARPRGSRNDHRRADCGEVPRAVGHVPCQVSERSVKAGLRYVTADTRGILEQMLKEGGAPPMIGYETSDPDGQYLCQLEAAWPVRRTAILVNAQLDRDSWLAKEGWDARRAAAWKPEDLPAALGVHE